MRGLPGIKLEKLEDWEDYVAIREQEFEEFREYYEGKNPLDAIEQYDFKYRYKLSPDKKTIFAFDKKW